MSSESMTSTLSSPFRGVVGKLRKRFEKHLVRAHDN